MANNHKGANMVTENTFGLNRENRILLQLAKNQSFKNRVGACRRLFQNLEEKIEKIQMYGPDGLRPKMFGYCYTGKGVEYGDVRGDCYLDFCKCVESFDMSRGIRFMTWVCFIFSKRAVDRLNRRFPEGECRDNYAGIYAVSDLFSLDAPTDEEQWAMQMDDGDAVREIRRYLQRTGDSKDLEFVETWLKFAVHAKNPMAAMAEYFGLSRQTMYNWLHSIQVKIRRQFGGNFYN